MNKLFQSVVFSDIASRTQHSETNLQCVIQYLLYWFILTSIDI